MAKITNKTKTEKSQTEEKPVIDSVKSFTWSIRDIDLETRAVYTKVAKMRGKTISQLMTGEIRAYLQGLLTQTKLPATSQDMDNQISLAKIMEKLEGIESRLPEIESKSFWGRLFH